MKSKIIIVSLICVAAFCTFLTSCEEESKMCTCVEEDMYSDYSASQQLDPASFGATNCSDLAVKLNMQAQDSDFAYDCY